jgi:hypothetical protein
MTKIEVPGTFIFESGEADFAFGEKTITFSRITSVEELRAVLVAIVHYGTQASIESIQKGETSDRAVPPTVARVAQGLDSVIKNSEHSFRQHVRNTEEALRRAEKDYEAATAIAAERLNGARADAIGSVV